MIPVSSSPPFHVVEADDDLLEVPGAVPPPGTLSGDRGHSEPFGVAGIPCPLLKPRWSGSRPEECAFRDRIPSVARGISVDIPC
jgi:hypothetical protein